MILCRRHQFVFVKTRKTASTSIEIALSEFCGPDDIITPISPKDEQVRTSLGYTGPQNYKKSLSRYTLRDWARLAVKLKSAKKFYNHIPARRIRSLVGRDVWANYYTFTVDRHPFDKVLSYYDWLNRNETRYASLEEFIQDGRLELLSNAGGWGLYTDETQQNVIVDDVFRYEELDEAMNRVADRVGLQSPLKLPQTKDQSRKSRDRSPRELLSNNDKEAIHSVFHREFQHLGYDRSPT